MIDWPDTKQKITAERLFLLSEKLLKKFPLQSQRAKFQQLPVQGITRMQVARINDQQPTWTDPVLLPTGKAFIDAFFHQQNGIVAVKMPRKLKIVVASTAGGQALPGPWPEIIDLDRVARHTLVEWIGLLEESLS